MTADLLSWREAIPPDVRDHAARWQAFCAAHPGFRARVVEWLAAERDRGQRRLSMARCWEALRGTLGPGVRLDNSWRALCARDIAEINPSLAALIETRRRRTA